MLKDIYDKLPEYYPEMYLDGYTPEEIYNALHKKMIEQYRNEENDDSVKVIITTKEKVK